MKRFFALLCVLVLTLSLTACGSKEEDPPKTDEPVPPAADSKGDVQTSPDAPASDEPQMPAGPAPEVKSDSKYVLAYQGCQLPMNADFAPILAYLGEPASYFEAESCAFDGLDKTYTYDGVEILTYPDGDLDRISVVRILTDAVSTAEGITIGSTAEDVTAAYGEGGSRYEYEDGDCLLSFILQDGKTVSVEYTALNDMLG